MGINLFFSSVSLLVLVVVFFWLYQSYRVDFFRDKMFALRDELFDYAASGNVSFDSKAYTVLRTAMNGSIQFAHCLNLSRVFVFSLGFKSYINSKGYSFSKTFSQALSEVDNDVKERLSHYHDRMNRLYFEHLVMTSPLLLVFIVLAPVILFFYFFFRQAFYSFPAFLIKTVFQRPLEQIDSAAFAAGKA